MLVENATSPWGQSWERVFPQALVHTVHSTCAFGTRACGKPFPKIVPMAKLDIPSQGLKLYNLRTLATCILKKNARRHKIDCQTRFVCHQIGLERQRCDERDLNAYSFFFNTLFFLVNFPRFSFIQYMRHLFHLSPLKRS